MRHEIGAFNDMNRVIGKRPHIAYANSKGSGAGQEKALAKELDIWPR